MTDAIRALEGDALAQLAPGAERLASAGRPVLLRLPVDPALFDAQRVVERACRAGQVSEESVLVGRHVLDVAQRCGMGRVIIVDVVDGRVPHVIAERRERVRTDGLRSEHVFLAQKPVELVVRKPFVLMVGGKEPGRRERGAPARIRQLDVGHAAFSERVVHDRRRIVRRKILVGEARCDAGNGHAHRRTERRAHEKRFVRAVVRSGTQREAAVRRKAGSWVRAERIDFQDAADSARAAQRRTCAAQEFGALDQIDRIRLPIDLSAEGVLRGDSVDEDHAAVETGAAERRSDVAVVRERAVAARLVGARQLAQQTVGGCGRRKRDRAPIDHRGRKRRLMEILARSGRDGDASDDRQRPFQHHALGAAPKDNVAPEVAASRDVRHNRDERRGRRGRARGVGRFHVVLSRTTHEIDRGARHGAPGVVDYDEALGRRHGSREEHYSKHRSNVLPIDGRSLPPLLFAPARAAMIRV